MANLIPNVTNYLNAAISSSTSTTYRSAWNSYQSFCLSACVFPFPLNQFILLFYVTFLARRVCYATIKVYLAAIQYKSNLFGYTSHIADMHQLFYLLRGVRRLQGSSRRRPRRCPVTINHLRLLFNYIQLANLHSTDKSMLCSAVTLAFFGMLRSAEYTSPTSSNFFIGSTLQPSDIHFRNLFNLLQSALKNQKPIHLNVVAPYALPQQIHHSVLLMLWFLIYVLGAMWMVLYTAFTMVNFLPATLFPIFYPWHYLTFQISTLIRSGLVEPLLLHRQVFRIPLFRSWVVGLAMPTKDIFDCPTIPFEM